MRLALVLGLVGRFLRVFALAFLAPALLALADGDRPAAARFLAALALTGLVGLGLGRRFVRGQVLLRSEALSVVAGTWLLVSVLGALPYALEGVPALDAWFESMSGFTTTGATILTDFGAHGRAFHLWRALTQWLGGLGVIALFVVILPHLGIGGRQLFFAEASAAGGEPLSARIRTTARRLWILYGILTVAQATALVLGGVSAYDAIVHALATVSAGGFSPHGRSVEALGGSAYVEWVFVLFMVLSGTSFTLLWRALRGSPALLLADGEFRAYLVVILAATLGVALVLAGGSPGEPEVRAAAFQVASLISSTGFASADFALWAPAATSILLAVMMVCSCAGSAGGGPKIVRLLIVGRFLGREMTQAIHPHAVIPLLYRGRLVVSQALRAVVAVVLLFFAGYLAVALVLVLLGVEPGEALSAAVACLNNVGPGLGEVGPMGSYAGLPPAAKVILTLAMWLGRLEILTVLAVLHPDAWRGLRWGGPGSSGGPPG